MIGKALTDELSCFRWGFVFQICLIWHVIYYDPFLSVCSFEIAYIDISRTGLCASPPILPSLHRAVRNSACCNLTVLSNTAFLELNKRLIIVLAILHIKGRFLSLR